MEKKPLYKILKDCKQGDWVYYDAGDLFLVDKEDGISGFVLRNGSIVVYASEDAIVYPLTLHNKIIADGIHAYYKRMHRSKLINGSKWVNWLNDKMGELIELGENAKREEYQVIWNSISDKISELEYHKSFLD
jgi:hypothetical protein